MHELLRTYQAEFQTSPRSGLLRYFWHCRSFFVCGSPFVGDHLGWTSSTKHWPSPTINHSCVDKKVRRGAACALLRVGPKGLLIKVLERIQSAGVTLNAAKYELSKPSLKFLGHCIDRDGVRADPDKTAAIWQMTPPHSVSDLWRSNIAKISKSLHELLSVKRAWLRGPEQDRASNTVKQELTKPTVLALYDPAAKSKVSANASTSGRV